MKHVFGGDSRSQGDGGREAGHWDIVVKVVEPATTSHCTPRRPHSVSLSLASSSLPWKDLRRREDSFSCRNAGRLEGRRRGKSRVFLTREGAVCSAALHCTTPGFTFSWATLVSREGGREQCSDVLQGGRGRAVL